jgi:hypothetical protein
VGRIDAAATKPFGFMKFTPGPGLGGHCIPLDPHYLSWKMRTLSFKTRMIELASEINAEMPAYVVRKVSDALNDRETSLKGSKVLILGVAYKKNIGDLRESPALDIIRLLQEKGAVVSYHDPYVPSIEDDGHTPLKELPMRSVSLTDQLLQSVDLALIVTDHKDVDYGRVLSLAPLVVDTGACCAPMDTASWSGFRERRARVSSPSLSPSGDSNAMKQVLLSGQGQVEVFDVPVPLRGPGGVLVRTTYSLISSGTEGAAVASRPGWLGVLEKARRSPDRVEQVWRLAKAQGVGPTWDLLRNKLADYTPLGYSAVGEIIEVDDPAGPFRVGQTLACVGGGVANHAEYLAVPLNLALPVPAGVPPSRPPSAQSVA